jgi:hypothetical protein
MILFQIPELKKIFNPKTLGKVEMNTNQFYLAWWTPIIQLPRTVSLNFIVVYVFLKLSKKFGIY